MSEKTQTIIFSGSREVSFVKTDLPELGDRDIQIESHRTAISQGTEKSFLINGNPNGKQPFPMYPGYSAAGIVTKIGAKVTRIRVGQRVVATGPHSSKIVVSEDLTIPIDDKVDFDSASFFNIAGMAVYSVKQSKIALPDPVAVLGQGMIGLIATQVARLCGAIPLVSFDLSEQRRELALQFGADLAIDPRNLDEIKDCLKKLPGHGFASVIELTGAKSGFETAIDIVRQRGNIFAGSLIATGNLVDVYGKLWWKGVSISTGYVNSRPYRLTEGHVVAQNWPPHYETGGEYFCSGSHSKLQDIKTYLDLISMGRLDMKPIITDHYKPDESPLAFKRILEGDQKMIGCVFDWQ